MCVGTLTTEEFLVLTGEISTRIYFDQRTLGGYGIAKRLANQHEHMLAGTHRLTTRLC